MTTLNHTIWIYWHQGWNDAPEIAQKCLATWISKNPDWKIVILDKENLSNYIQLEEILNDYHNKDFTLASLSDIIRICLLYKYGGVWVDSTLFCRIPLIDWIDFLEGHDFFAFSNPEPGRLVSSWFLIAKDNSYIIDKWYHQTLSYWQNKQQTDKYFWFHYQFNYLFETDPNFKSLWNNTPKKPASEPHYFIPYKKNFFIPLSKSRIHEIERVNTAVFKLTHKFDHQKDISGTVFEYLLNNDLPMKSSKILVTWYGSFKNNGTVGDYLSVKVLTRYLKEKHFDIDCASYKNFKGLEGNIVKLEELDPNDYQIMIFCCGPIMKNHTKLSALFKSFENQIKIGVGVSLFPKKHQNYYNPFDAVFARENGEHDYDDLAILDCGSNHIDEKDKEFKVGLVLRNHQIEYGAENCLSEQTNEALLKVAKEVVKNKRNVIQKINAIFGRQTDNIMFIDNHLATSGKTPEAIEQQYQQCQIILTTRFHGAIISLKNNIPFLAVDQINDGAKVYRLLSHIGYPHVWKVNEFDEKHAIHIAKSLLRGKYDSELKVIIINTKKGAQNTLSDLEDTLNRIV